MSLLGLASVLFIMLFQNCSMVAPTQELASSSSLSSLASLSANPVFSELQQKIITPKCLACHSSGLHNFSSYSNIMASGTVVAGNISGSTFYLQVLAGTMPLGRQPLAASETAAIKSWIETGALNLAPGVSPPTNTPPLSISAVAAIGTSPTSITLTWTLPSGTLTSVIVERAATVAGPFSIISTLGGSVSTYIDTGLTANLNYSYRVKAMNTFGVSPYSAVVSAMTLPFPPANPTGLSAVPISSSQINLNWVDNSVDESGFIIERAPAVGGPFTVLLTTAANVTTYSDTGLAASTTFYYRVAATNAGGKSAYTSTASALTATAAAGIPASPASVSALATSATQVTLTWTDSSTSETGFKVERALAATGPFTVIGSVGANVTTFPDSGLSAVTTYYYRVSSFNASGSSSPTASMSVTTFGTYAWINANVSIPKCVMCHSGGSPAAGYDLSTYTGTLLFVTKFNSGVSRFYLASFEGSMPLGSAKLTSVQLSAIKTWIDSGALNN